MSSGNPDSDQPIPSANSESRPADLRNPSQSLVWLVVAGILFAGVLLFAGKLIETRGSGMSLLPDLLYLVASTVVGGTVFYVSWRAHPGLGIRLLMCVAIAMVIMTPLAGLVERIPILDDLPLIGDRSPYANIIQESYLMGVALLFLALCLTLLAMARAQNVIKQERAALSREVIERKQIAQALAEREEQYRLFLDGTNDGIALVGRDMRPILANQRMIDLFGYTVEDFEDKDAAVMVHPDDLGYVIKNNRGRLAGKDVPRTYEFRMVHKDGTVIPVEGSFDLLRRHGEVIGVQGVYRDISERKRAAEEHERLQERTQRAEKLESLVVLAGGIAHDFNNLLTGVLGNASLALHELPPESPIRTYLREIEKAAQRAAELSTQMLAFSGGGWFAGEPVNLSSLVTGMKLAVQEAVSKQASIQYDLDPDVPLIQGDPSHLRPAVLGIITNASEALGDESGIVVIRTGTMVADEEYVRENCFDPELPAGPYVFIEVADTGAGMDAETLHRAFDPFFSTKFTGRGLGLAAVIGIVRVHKGGVKVTSTPGKGATFRVLFPPFEAPTD